MREPGSTPAAHNSVIKLGPAARFYKLDLPVERFTGSRFHIDRYRYEPSGSLRASMELHGPPFQPAPDPDPGLPKNLLHRRLAAATGQPPQEAIQDLLQAARDASDAPAYPLMQNLCRTLADPHRLLAAALLKRNPDLSATELQVALQVSQATVSHHLLVLREAGLIMTQPDGKWVRYRLDSRYDRLIP